MKNIIKIFIWIHIFILASCSGEIDPLEYLNEGELRYPGKANDITYFAGKDRLMIQFKLGPDPNVNKAVIYWNLKKDSVIVDINKNSLTNNIVEKLIEDIPEDVYNFEVYTYDKFGNKSVPTYLTGRTYGKRFSSNLNDREITNYEAAGTGNDIKLLWSDSILSSAGVELTYTDLENKKKTLLIENTESSSILEKVNANEPIDIMTLFLPEPNAIDTFKSQSVLNVDPSKLTMEIPKPYASGYVDGFDFATSGDWNALWDGKWGKTFKQDTGGGQWAGEAGWKSFETKDTTPGKLAESTWFTVDIGSSVKVARYRTGFYWPYMMNCPKKTELWAYIGTGVPTASEAWNNWEKIGSIDNSTFLPTEEDMKREYPLGDNIYTDYETVPKARFYRIRCTDNWDTRAGQSKTAINLSEVTFWRYIN